MKKKKTDEEIKNSVEDKINKFKAQNPEMTEEEINHIRDLFMSFEYNELKSKFGKTVYNIFTRVVFYFLVYLAFMGFCFSSVVVKHPAYVFIYTFGVALIQGIFKQVLDYISSRFGHPLFWYFLFLCIFFIGLIVLNTLTDFLVFSSNWWIGLFFFGTEIFSLVWQYTTLKRRLLG